MNRSNTKIKNSTSHTQSTNQNNRFGTISKIKKPLSEIKTVEEYVKEYGIPKTKEEKEKFEEWCMTVANMYNDDEDDYQKQSISPKSKGHKLNDTPSNGKKPLTEIKTVEEYVKEYGYPETEEEKERFKEWCMISEKMKQPRVIIKIRYDGLNEDDDETKEDAAPKSKGHKLNESNEKKDENEITEIEQKDVIEPKELKCEGGKLKFKARYSKILIEFFVYPTTTIREIIAHVKWDLQKKGVSKLDGTLKIGKNEYNDLDKTIEQLGLKPSMFTYS